MNHKTNTRKVTIAVMIATFLAAIEGTIVSTAMPTIVGELGGLQLISWVVSIYLLTSAVTTPIYGKLSDLFGRKVIFIIGTSLFLAGSVLSGLSQTMEMLIWFRAFQGMGAGAIITLTYTIIGDIYPFEERGKIQGWMSGIWGISGVLGPLTGGFLVDYVSWHWIFYMNLPFGIISILLIGKYLHEDLEKTRKQIDYAGVITFTVSMTALLYALLSGGDEHPWDSPLIVGLLVLAVCGLVLFVNIERKSVEPMVPLQLFGLRAITIANMTGFLLAAILVAVSFYVPLWIQGVYGKGAVGAGLALIPMSVCWPIGAACCGRLLAKVGIRNLALTGVAFLIAATAWLASISMQSPQWMLFGITGLVGLGFGFAFTAFTGAVLSVERNLRGAAMATNTLIRTVGQTLGIAAFGTMFNQAIREMKAGVDVNQVLNPDTAMQFPPEVLHAVREGLAAGLHSVFAVLVVLAVIGFVLAWASPGRMQEQKSA